MTTNSTTTVTVVPLQLHKRNRKNVKTYFGVLSIALLISSFIMVFYLLRNKDVGFPKPDNVRPEILKTPSGSKSKKFQEVFTESKFQAINALRNSTQMYFTKPFMNESFYLAKWLNENDWSISDAEEMLLEHLEWRSENNIDNILQEDFSYWKSELPYYMDGIDFEGRPVLTGDSSTWDIRKVLASGKSQEMLRYGHYNLERGVQLVLKAREEGKNVSRLVILVDMGNFNLAQHACFSCLGFITEYLFGSVDNYPGWVHRLILINTPESFEMLLSMAAPVVRGEYKEALLVFGKNEKEWKTELFSLVPKDQLRIQFGGTKDEDAN